MDFDRRVDDLLVHPQLLAHQVGGQRQIVRHDAERAGIGPLTDPPDVQIGDPRFPGIWSGFDGLADLRFRSW